MPQTLRFVIDELKKAKPDPGLVEYAIALAFSEFRSASQYEERGEAIADDIADGVPPEKVRQFRQGLLDLRKMPNLSDELFKRMGRRCMRASFPVTARRRATFRAASFTSSGRKNSLLPTSSISRASRARTHGSIESIRAIIGFPGLKDFDKVERTGRADSCLLGYR